MVKTGVKIKKIVFIETTSGRKWTSFLASLAIQLHVLRNESDEIILEDNQIVLRRKVFANVKNFLLILVLIPLPLFSFWKKNSRIGNLVL